MFRRTSLSGSAFDRTLNDRFLRDCERFIDPSSNREVQ